MLKWSIVLSLVVGCGASARIMTVPATADLSTFPTLAEHCVNAKRIVERLGVLTSDKDLGISLLGKVANNFASVTDSACKDVTHAEAAACWKACSTEWSQFEVAIARFAESAKAEGVAIDPLQ